MKIEIAGQPYVIGPVTLKQVVTLQRALAVWQRLGEQPLDVRRIGADDAQALAEAVAAVLRQRVDVVMDWPLAQTLVAAVLAGRAFVEVNGPYLVSDVAPAVEALAAFATSLTAALQPKAA